MIKAKFKVGDRVIRAERIYLLDANEIIIPSLICIVEEVYIDSGVLTKDFGETTYHLIEIESSEEFRYVKESDIILDKKYYREETLKEIL